jgi:hypothetical protein
MSRIEIGDHVALKGMLLTGFTGTVITKPKRLTGNLRVRLDGGQLRGGHTILSVNRINIRKTAAEGVSKCSLPARSV